MSSPATLHSTQQYFPNNLQNSHIVEHLRIAQQYNLLFMEVSIVLLLFFSNERRQATTSSTTVGLGRSVLGAPRPYHTAIDAVLLVLTGHAYNNNKTRIRKHLAEMRFGKNVHCVEI